MNDEFDSTVDTSFDDTPSDVTDSSFGTDSGDVGSYLDDTVDASEYADDFFEDSTDVESLMSDGSDTDSITTMDTVTDIDASDAVPLVDDVAGDSTSDIDALMADTGEDESSFDTAGDLTGEFNDPSTDAEALMDDSSDVSAAMDDLTDLDSDDQSVSGEYGESATDITSLMDDSEDTDVYQATPNSDIQIVQEDGSIDTLENIMAANTDTDTDMPADVEPYQATPNSDIQIVQADGSVDTLENIMAANADTNADAPADLVQPAEDLVTDGSDNTSGDIGGEAMTDHSDVQGTAYDQLMAYMSDHNYGKQHEAEYSQDPEWQELNNAFRVEEGLEPINYETKDWKDTHVDDEKAMLIAMGMPEDSPELASILQMEQQGIDDILKGEDASDVESLMDDAGDLDSIVNYALVNEESGDTSSNIENLMNDTSDATGVMDDVDLNSTESLDAGDPLIADSILVPSESLEEVEATSAFADFESPSKEIQEEIDRIVGSQNLSNTQKIELLTEMQDMLPHVADAKPAQAEQIFEIEPIDDGVTVKVLSLDGSGTGIAHYNYEQELADLDQGISNWQKMQQELADSLNLEIAGIQTNPELSDAERDFLLAHAEQKKMLMAEQWDIEAAQLMADRDLLQSKVNASMQDMLSPESIEGVTGGPVALKASDVMSEMPQIADVSNWISEINPNFDPYDLDSPYCNNCGSCAFAVEQRFEGNSDIVATSQNIGTIEEMNKLTGMEQVAMSPDQIREYLISQGPGSHGIVGIDRVSGPGHWFNAYYDGQKVVAIDGQTGEVNDWPPDYGDVTNWDISVRKEGR